MCVHHFEHSLQRILLVDVWFLSDGKHMVTVEHLHLWTAILAIGFFVLIKSTLARQWKCFNTTMTYLLML